MRWFIGGGEIVAGLALFAGLVMLFRILRPPKGTIQERAILRFPLAWLFVGLPLTIAFATSVAFIAVGLYTLV